MNTMILLVFINPRDNIVEVYVYCIHCIRAIFSAYHYIDTVFTCLEVDDEYYTRPFELIK